MYVVSLIPIETKAATEPNIQSAASGCDMVIYRLAEKIEEKEAEKFFKLGPLPLGR